MDEKKEIVGQFIGPDKIESITQCEQTTPQGEPVFEVKLAGGKKSVYSGKTLPYVVSEKETDFNTVQQKKFEPIIREVLEVMFEYDVKLGEFEALMQNIGRRVDSHIGRATNLLWTGDDTQYVPGFDPMYDVSFLMADAVIKDTEKNK